MSFETLGLKAPLLKALAAYGYREPTPIQIQAIPSALAGRDVLGCAQTGTGKTCAFGAPIIQRLSENPGKGKGIRSLILTPTRELAIQIEENLKAYSKGTGIRSAVIFGGVGQAPQVEAIRRGIDILTATPGRLMDLHNQKLLDLSKVEIFVLDEADRMLDMGFINDVKKILAMLPKQKQTLFFSATMPPEITDLVNSLMENPVRVAVDAVSSPVEVIQQRMYLVDRKNKTTLLAKIIREESVKNALVFTRTKHGEDKVIKELLREGVEAAAIHGNKSQTARQAALARFKAGSLQVLVATDIAARGLDIEELAYVFNYNLPEVAETYIHRIGRTGRAGHGGTAISFCDFSEKPMLKGIEKLMGRSIPLVEDHPYPIEVFEVAKRDAKGRLVNPDDEEARAAAREAKAQRRSPGQKTPASPKGKGAPPQAKQQPKQAAAPVQPPVEEPGTLLKRRNPLEGDVIMDATARLLAARRPAQGKGPGQENRQARPGNGQGRNRKPARQAEEKPVQEAKAPIGQKRPKGKGVKKPPLVPPISRGEIPAPPQGGRKKGGQPSLPSTRSEARNRGGYRKAPPVEVSRSHQKDSTEQPSLMKPFYINND